MFDPHRPGCAGCMILWQLPKPLLTFALAFTLVSCGAGSPQEDGVDVDNLQGMGELPASNTSDSSLVQSGYRLPAGEIPSLGAAAAVQTVGTQSSPVIAAGFVPEAGNAAVTVIESPIVAVDKAPIAATVEAIAVDVPAAPDPEPVQQIIVFSVIDELDVENTVGSNTAPIPVAAVVTPEVQTIVAEPPAAATPVMEAPAAETPVVEAPAVETAPVVEEPALQAASGSEPASTESVPPGFLPGDTADNLYGPQTAGGVCPDIGETFKRTTIVSSFAEFDAAYKTVMPGEAIIIKNGTYNWTNNVPKSTAYAKAARPYFLDRSGTLAEPIYIISESPLGVHFENSRVDWIFTGSYQVMAGFKSTNTGRKYILAPDNRIACGYFSGMQGGAYVLVESEGADRVEIDNSVFDGAAFNALVFWRCNPTSSVCTKNSKGAHIHHNTFKNKAYTGVNGHEAIVLGLGYYPVPEATTYNVDKTNMDAIIENNLFDGWNGENELITIKSSHNILRNNCVINSPNANFKFRNGSDNLVTGNWWENASGGIEISGQRNFVVFNYKARKANNYYGFRLHTGEQYTSSSLAQYRELYRYVDASDNMLSYNVFSGISYLAEGYSQINAIFRAKPNGNTISNNTIYTTSFVGTNESGGYFNGDGRMSEAEFRSNNTWGQNTIEGYKLPDSVCGNAALFDGPGGPGATISGASNLLGAPATISAPSWW